MGGKDHCCILGCTSRRDKPECQNLPFYRIPAGISAKGEKKRRVRWLQAIRRENFVLTLLNKKVCGLHFVTSLHVDNANSVDYCPFINLGCETGPRRQARTSKTSLRTQTLSMTDMSRDERPDVSANVTVSTSTQ